jgi:KaiC/GvpD/RAD55 family RecA-like ATPase
LKKYDIKIFFNTLKNKKIHLNFKRENNDLDWVNQDFDTILKPDKTDLKVENIIEEKQESSNQENQLQIFRVEDVINPNLKPVENVDDLINQILEKRNETKIIKDLFKQNFNFFKSIVNPYEFLQKNLDMFKKTNNVMFFSSNKTFNSSIGVQKNKVSLTEDSKKEKSFQNSDESDAKINSDVLENVESSRKKDTPKKKTFMNTSIKGFDNLLEKGIPTGSNIIVAGGPGCGKTIFCLQTLYNKASEGYDCVFLSMEEKPERLRDHMFEFGFQIDEIKRSDNEIILKVNNKGRISLKRLQPIRLARSIEALLEKASGRLPVDIDLVLDFIPEDFDAHLLILDSISAIETAFSGTKRQYRIYIEQLFRYFESLHLTTFLITESSDAPHKFSNTGVEEFLADGIFVFYNFQGVKKRTRGVEIYKLRGAAHSQRIVPMNITNNGIRISPDDSCASQTKS